MAADGKPVLWHIPISHYSEKVRWALSYKQVAHERRAPPPPAHMLLALAFTRGEQSTFPVLQLNGQRIGDSTAIIAELERRFPEPPLYPSDDTERRRTLALEDWFDEQLGPPIRLLAWHHVTRDPQRLERVVEKQVPGVVARANRAVAAGARSFVNLRYGVQSQEAAEAARQKALEALDRLGAELGGADYLVAGRFSVADLTAAALFYPLVLPPEGPRLLEDLPEPLERFAASLRERRGYRWVAEMFRRHRRSAAAAATA